MMACRIQDIQNDVNQLADSLESVLKSWGSDAKGEAEAARSKAQALLKETRARMHGRTRVQQAARQQAARDAVASKPRAMPLAARILLFVKDPGVVWVQRQRGGFLAAAVGIFIGALLSMRKS